jgi:Flp pilus assembly protein TadG
MTATHRCPRTGIGSPRAAATSRTRRLHSVASVGSVASTADGGAATVLLLLLTPALFALAGLVLDGGTHLAARQRAADLAEQAARAGADQLDTSGLRSTAQPLLDTTRATTAACRYVRTMEPDATCTATVLPAAGTQELQVRVRTVTPTALLGLIGINTLHADALGSAQAVTGIRTTLPQEGP